MEELMALLEYMTPEEQQQLLGMGSIPGRSQLVQGQLDRAQGLMQPQSGRHTTLGGAIGGGLGDVARSLIGGFQTADADKRLAALLAQQDAGRGLYAEALGRPRKMGATGEAAGQMAGGAMLPFGLGGAGF